MWWICTIFAEKQKVLFWYNSELKAFLEEKVVAYNNPGFIETDPIYVPHLFIRKEDIEVSAFLTASIAWGNRRSIIQNGLRLMHILGNSPFDFVMSHREHHLERLQGFVHRTFNAIDAVYFVKALRYIYRHQGGLEMVFSGATNSDSVIPAIVHFHKTFFSIPHPVRSVKHVSNPGKGSPAKRINLFLRWMVREDRAGVDFGLWKQISPRQLSCPLDVHSGNVARKLGLIGRKQNDLKALQELDTSLRLMDPSDPVKYDYALFGLGVFEGYGR